MLYLFYQIIVMIHEIKLHHGFWHLRPRQWKLLLIILTSYVPQYIRRLSSLPTALCLSMCGKGETEGFK